MPAEFEKQSAILLGCNQLLPDHPQAMLDIISALIDRIALIAVVNSEEQRRDIVTLLCDWGLPAQLLHFIFLPVKGMWVRDYGPAFVQIDGRITILDPQYYLSDRPEDDDVPTQLGALWRVPVTKLPLRVEGGNILSNGQGLGITSTSFVLKNAKIGHGYEQAMEMLRQYYGFEHIALIPHLEHGTTGHVDMYATLLAPNVVVLGQYDPRADPVNAAKIEEAAKFLATVPTRSGPMQVVRIPMPPHSDGVWRTYTNVLYVNDTLLVPSYSDVHPSLQAKVFETYQRLLPGWEIIAIKADTLIRAAGALRCVSLNIPWLQDRFPPPDVGYRGISALRTRAIQ
jgi:agmatine/peptidylarginine deiminase